MKIVKLNRRFRQFKDHGHTVGLKFIGWSKDADRVEKICRQFYNTGGWSRDADWYSYYGNPDYSGGYAGQRAYWVTLRNEADLSAILLMLDK